MRELSGVPARGTVLFPIFPKKKRMNHFFRVEKTFSPAAMSISMFCWLERPE